MSLAPVRQTAGFVPGAGGFGFRLVTEPAAGERAGTIVAVAVSWGVMTARQDAADQRQAAQGVEFSRAIARIDEALKEQRNDQKDLAKAVQAITTDTALIRGRLASNDGPTRGAK